MPINRLRALTGRNRTASTDRALGLTLAFVAGAVNAGGFLVVGQYTSHMTGFFSLAADATAAAQFGKALAAAGTILSFVCGAIVSTMLINRGRRRGAHSVYALPLFIEAALLLVFGVIGGTLEHHRPLVVPATVSLLCFVMGLQNALITKISDARIRTTHLTGLTTDIGIELGKFAFSRLDGPACPVKPDFGKLRLWCALAGCFLLGGLGGALAFTRIGFSATIPLAVLLAILAEVPIADDLPKWPRFHR